MFGFFSFLILCDAASGFKDVCAGKDCSECDLTLIMYNTHTHTHTHTHSE